MRGLLFFGLSRKFGLQRGGLSSLGSANLLCGLRAVHTFSSESLTEKEHSLSFLRFDQVHPLLTLVSELLGTGVFDLVSQMWQFSKLLDFVAWTLQVNTSVNHHKQLFSNAVSPTAYLAIRAIEHCLLGHF